MKKTLATICSLMLAASGAMADCQVELNVIQPTGDDVPEASAKALATRLATAANKSGSVGDNNGGPFYLTARFDHLNKGVLAGPPQQHTLTSELTILIGNSETNQILASHTMTLKGVGSSDQKAFLNAMRGITAANTALQQFLAKGREEIISYYDRYAPQLVAQADKATALGNYAEALSILVQVPECSRAYGQTLSEMKKCYTLYADREGTDLLKKAQTLWASDPTPAGAAEASRLLTAIPVGSKAEKGADALYAEMASALKDDYKFETRQKYSDSLDLEKRRIEAAKQVGTAYGHGQKSSTTIIPVK